jgi:predicted oxidoreductase
MLLRDILITFTFVKQQQKYSKVIAGVMTWGNRGTGMTALEMQGLMHACIELGITTFDHADIYGGYTTEADFGSAFVQSGIPRNQVQFISKCGIQYPSEQRPLKVKHYQYDRAYILWSAEKSLKNLKTDYLDMLLLHRPSPLMDPEEIAAAFSELSNSGKVLSFGVSNFSPSQIALIESAAPVEAHQFECSITYRQALYNGVLDDCLAHKRMAMAWSPLGSYFRDPDAINPSFKDVLNRLMEKYNAEASQLFLAWLMRHPAGIFPVVGTTKKERIKLAMEATQIKMELEDWFEILELAQGHQVP